jgi:uncharacterized membrane protein YjdF
MTAPEPARKVYWTLQIIGLIVVAGALIASGVAWDGGPVGYVLAGLCLVVAVGLAVLRRRSRL